MLTILNSLCPISHDEFIVCKYAKTDFKHLHTHTHENLDLYYFHAPKTEVKAQEMSGEKSTHLLTYLLRRPNSKSQNRNEPKRRIEAELKGEGGGK